MLSVFPVLTLMGHVSEHKGEVVLRRHFCMTASSLKMQEFYHSNTTMKSVSDRSVRGHMSCKSVQNVFRPVQMDQI